MKIAIASGKGGTGKTTLAVNLAMSGGEGVQLLDCDVEEPNCHIFMRPEIGASYAVAVPVPRIDEDKCKGCGRCARFCQYNAIVTLQTKSLVFPELCHGCGGCMMLCPRQAISEVGRDVGIIEKGTSFVHGCLRVGEAMSPPLIRAVRKEAKDDGLVIIDAPPGTSCPVIAAIKDTDFVMLVTEPTPFGLHDLSLAVDMVRELGIPFAVAINRVGVGDDRVHKYCEKEGISIIAEIPDDRRIAEAYSRGEPIVDVLPEYAEYFKVLFDEVTEQ